MIPANITSELAVLKAQTTAAAPLSNASIATIKALQLNASQLVADIQSSLVATNALDTLVLSGDPLVLVNGVLQLKTAGFDQSNLSLMRGVVGRAASNLDQL